jgi:hypothetical protein
MLLLYIGALLAEVSGLALAAHGFRRTWLEFRKPDDEFWAPISRPVEAGARSAYVRLRRLIGKPVPPKTVSVTATAAIGLSSAASATVRWGPLPPVDADPAAFMSTLTSRLSALNDRTQALEARLQKDAEAAETRHTQATKAIDQVREEARGQVRTITVGGLREQVAGLLLIAAGVIAAGVGDIVNAA